MLQAAIASNLTANPSGNIVITSQTNLAGTIVNLAWHLSGSIDPLQG